MSNRSRPACETMDHPPGPSLRSLQSPGGSCILGLPYFLPRLHGCAAALDESPRHRPGPDLGLDVFLPVPSNVLLTLNGKFFGFTGGALLNLAGCLAGGGVAWYTGRIFKSETTRALSLEELFTAQRMVKKWGLLAVVASRPIPILAEAVAVTAAASGIGPGWFAAGILLGSIPICLVYALAGAYAGQVSAWGISLGAAVLLSLVCWLWARRFVRRTARDQGAGAAPSGSAEKAGS